MKNILFAILFAVALQGCTRIETGEAGLRVGFDKQVSLQELPPGSFNQVFVGDVLTFPVRDIAMSLTDLKAQTSDGSTLSDFDVTVIYSINPSAVGELFTTKSKAFHAKEQGDTFLMYYYIETLARSAAYKAVATFPALETIRKRDQIEAEVAKNILQALKDEKLDTALTITKIQVRAIQPAQVIIDAANDAIAAENKLLTAKTLVKIAEQEALRQEFLSRPANLEYMKARTGMNYSEAAKEGKVQVMIVPHNFTMLGSIK